MFITPELLKARKPKKTESIFDHTFVTQETLLKGCLKTSQPPAQDARPFSSGRSSVQRREEVGIVNRALSTAALRKLKNLSEQTYDQCNAAAIPTVEFKR